MTRYTEWQLNGSRVSTGWLDGRYYVDGFPATPPVGVAPRTVILTRGNFREVPNV